MLEAGSRLSIPFVLRVPGPILERVLDQARAELPNECCGLMAGNVHAGIGQVVEVYPLVNELASPTEFLSESRSLIRAHRAMRERGVEVLAVYHSHPTSPPRPSRTDIDRSHGDQVMALIVSLQEPQPRVEAWWLSPEVLPGQWEIG